MSIPAPAPAPAPTPARLAGKRWYIASAVTFFVGGIMTVVIAIAVAAIKVASDPIVGAQSGWNVWAFMVYAFQVSVTGWGGVFALAAAVLALVGLLRHGARPLGIVLLVVCLVVSLQLLAVPVSLATFDVYIY